MSNATPKQFFTAVFLFILIHSNAQNTRAFNQNASRSNHTRLSFSVTPVYTNPVNSNSDTLLFRGSGGGVRFSADYFLGKVSIGLMSGFGSSSSDNTAINNFLKKSSIPQDLLVVTKTNQQNMYLLLGPSIQFGEVVQLHAHVKGGLFINNAGSVNIQQQGAQRATYRNESTGKSVYPGFLTGLNIQYVLRPGAWSVGLGADYMSTRTEVNNYDIRRGGGTEGLKLSRNVSDIVAGVTLRYTITSPRDAASGRPTGKRSASDRDAASGLSTGRRSHAVVAPDPDADGEEANASNRDAASGRPTGRRSASSDRDAASGLSTGRRSHAVVAPDPDADGEEANVSNRDAASGRPTGRRSAMAESCGPVTRKRTQPDGSSEEMTFSCPADAIAYDQETQSVYKEKMPIRWSAPETPLRAILIEADLDGDGTYEADVTSQISDEFTVDQKGIVQQKAGISTSHSNVRTRGQLTQVSSNLFTCTATGLLNNKETPLRVVYKSRHDIALNSIRNMK